MKKIFAVLAVAFVLVGGRAFRAHAQYSSTTQYDVDRLASAMFAPVFSNLAKDHIYSRNFNKLYKICYDEIYSGKTLYPAPAAYFYLGACYELGLGGCDVKKYKAKELYTKGADKGDPDCKQRLKDIRREGYWSATKANRDNFARKHGVPMSGTAPAAPSPASGPNSHSSGKTVCSSCGGTGVCNYCGGTGEYWIDAGTYVANDAYVKRKCAQCHGTKKCPVCHGKGSF